MARFTSVAVSKLPSTHFATVATRKLINIESVYEQPVCTRERAILAGSQLMLEKGYHGTSVKDIVVATGIPKGSFYNYFASKEEFVIEALEYYLEKRIGEFTGDIEDADLSCVQRISSIFRKYPEHFPASEFSPMDFMNKMYSELKDSHPTVAEIVSNFFNRFRDGLADCLAVAQKQGQLSAEKDPVVLADFILNSWHGALLHNDNSGNKDRLAAFCNILERYLLL